MQLVCHLMLFSLFEPWGFPTNLLTVKTACGDESKLTNLEVFFVNVFVIPLSFKGLGVIVENLELQCWELCLDSSAGMVISYELSLH